MRKKLELKILTLVVVLLLLGILGAGIMVMTIEKESLYRITETSSATTAEVIAKDVERTMIEGRADIVKALVEELKSTKGIGEISLINYEGRPAFDKSAPAAESTVMKEIAQTRAASVRRGMKKLVFVKPLLNGERCRSCHATDPEVLGAVRISFSIEREYNKASALIQIVLLVTVAACIGFSLILWLMIRKMVIRPVKSLEGAAQKLSGGDLSFDVNLAARDEIGRVSNAIKDSLLSISGILMRIKDASTRVSRVVEEVEKESKQVADGTHLETEAINNISSSIVEMNAVMSEIADGADGLAVSAEETAASMEQMVSSISQITGSTQDLSMAVESTSASIEQLSATIKEVANNAGELASAAGETQSSMIEISTSIREVEQRAKESATISEKVKTDAITFGMTSIEKTIGGMKDIKSSVEKTADYIKKLGGRSEEIGQILNVIDEITDQTTMLALNAAILAAQAGEHGKGFSVVADEIKELAQRTSVSTQEIATLIQSVQGEVHDAVVAMEAGLKSVESGFSVTHEAADALRKIIEGSKKSSDMAARIEHATAEQSRATKLVSAAMEKVLSMVEQIAKATTEQNRGIRLIMDATEKVRDVTNHVRTATDEQSVNTRQISQAVELVSDKSQQISRAINEQKTGSNQIVSAVEKIKDMPLENRDRAFRLNQLVRDLQKDAELTVTEMEKFRFSADTGSAVLRMGVIPLESPSVMYRKFTPLTDYLSAKLKRRIDLKVAMDFEGAVHDLGQGATQFCFMTPSTYVEAHRKYGVRVLVKALREGKPFQHSVIVARNDSVINAVEDIKGRTFAFGDPHSTSSHIVPRGMLHAAGIDIKDLLYHNYLGHHDDVARAVLNGDFDAGGIMESTAYKYRDKGLRLVKFSEDIPEFNICVSAGLDEKTARDLKDAFLSLNDGSAEAAPVLVSVNESYTGFVEASDADYDGIRTMMAQIGLI